MHGARPRRQGPGHHARPARGLQPALAGPRIRQLDQRGERLGGVGRLAAVEALRLVAELAHEALIVHLARLSPQEYARLAMIPTGAASALSVLAAAPSKVPFYVAGGVLAAWAVGLAVFGTTHPGFPSSTGGRRGVIAASLLLVLATISMAVVTSGEEHEDGEAAATSTELTLTADASGAIAFDRREATLKTGTVTITLVNDSSIAHNVAVARGGQELGRSETITGDETELRVDLRPGEYVFYCAVTGHRAAGMEGTLTVR